MTAHLGCCWNWQALVHVPQQPSLPKSQMLFQECRCLLCHNDCDVCRAQVRRTCWATSSPRCKTALCCPVLQQRWCDRLATKRTLSDMCSGNMQHPVAIAACRQPARGVAMCPLQATTEAHGVNPQMSYQEACRAARMQQCFHNSTITARCACICDA